jgi:hypothetical protein
MGLIRCAHIDAATIVDQCMLAFIQNAAVSQNFQKPLQFHSSIVLLLAIAVPCFPYSTLER